MSEVSEKDLAMKAGGLDRITDWLKAGKEGGVAQSLRAIRAENNRYYENTA